MIYLDKKSCICVNASISYTCILISDWTWRSAMEVHRSKFKKKKNQNSGESQEKVQIHASIKQLTRQVERTPIIDQIKQRETREQRNISYMRINNIKQLQKEGTNRLKHPSTNLEHRQDCSEKRYEY